MTDQNQGASIEAEREYMAWLTSVYEAYNKGEADTLPDMFSAWQAARRTPATAVGAGELPPLPKPAVVDLMGDFHFKEAYTADQMRDYARAAIAADRAQRQAPVVREVPPKRDVPEAEYSGPVLENAMEIGEATGWNACIDAMLATSPATVTAPAQPETLAYWKQRAERAENLAFQFARDGDNLCKKLDSLAAPTAQQAAPTGTLGYALFRNGKQEGIERSREMAERWVKAEIVPLVADPATTGMVEDAKDAASEQRPHEWQPVTGPGQVRKGDKLRFKIGDKTYNERAKLILHSGTNKEEVIYDKGRNFYFITSMVMSGKSNHKCVEFLAAQQAKASAKDEGGAA